MVSIWFLLCSVTPWVYFTLTVESVVPSAPNQCPQGCTCIHYHHASCVNFSLSDLPIELPKATVRLTLNSGQMPVIPRDSFLNNFNLKALQLRNSNIQQISPGAFKGLSKLRTLHVVGNNIETLQTSSFGNITGLRLLSLQHNLIANIMPGAFSSLRRVISLDLSYNNLAVLMDQTFIGLRALLWLHLGNNRIAVISSKAFEDNRSLRLLSLESNRLTAVPTKAMDSFSRLSSLSLSDNIIPRLSSGTFGPGLRYLESLHLDNTSLAEISSGAFSMFRNLKVLSMRSNRLVTLSFSKDFESIRWLRLGGNPWKCDCGLRWLRDMLLRQNAKDQVKCISPSAQTGKLLVKVELQYLTCPYNLYASTTSSPTAMNHSATRQVTAHATPNVSSSWTTPKATPMNPDPCLSNRITEVIPSEVTTNSLLVNWNVPEVLGDDYEIWYSTGMKMQSLRMIGGVREVELTELEAGAFYKICVVPLSSFINKCIQPTANQCTVVQTLGLLSSPETIQSGDKGHYIMGTGISITIILFIIIASIIAFKLKSRNTGFQRHYDEDVQQSKIDFDQINSGYENISDEDIM
ncbi:chondroadherin-like [Hemiscyllium ocellatum]|uniref:chondroadherin-like n=1 Tax=Hemiscyllium ocellatum TaxID=170820 RepID=UPI00296698B8|nr:chondroadherin-like [Hemiscyllium ocellatum]XP_060705265.1 chondroadherin-like [Hemiscyllium ocellatum]